MTDRSIDVLREKLEFLRREEATTANPTTKFELKKRIEEVEADLKARTAGITDELQPSYPDERTRELSEKLKAVFKRQAALLSAGRDVSAVREEILDLKRKFREGGQLKPGDFLLGDRFQLLESIGEGGFAEVWKAFDYGGEQGLVAVKVLHGQFAKDRTTRERFFRGARQMRRLQHQSIVRVIEEACEDGGFYFFVMEHVKDSDLRKAIDEGRVSLQRALEIVVEIGEVLEFAHDHRVVHRDVKPSNILLDKQTRPKLTDFDLVRAIDTTGGTRTSMLGTFPYAAPELMQKPQEADVRADVYGLGMTAVYAAYGADLPLDVMYNRSAFLEKLDVDQTVRSVLSKAVAWEAAERWATTLDFCDALRKAFTPERIAELEVRHRETQAELRNLESTVLDVDAGERSVTIVGDADKTIILTGDGNRVLVSEAEPEILWQAYLAVLADECGRLPLGIIDTEFARAGGGPRRVRLSEVYVELDVTRTARPARAEEEAADGGRDWAWSLVRGEAGDRVAARDVLAEERGRHYVLLGDPGSGKTTFAHQLCRALAVGDDVPDGIAGLLPMRFALRDVASHLLGSEVPLWDALERELGVAVGGVGAARLLPWVLERLRATGGLVVLDGLDEVPESERRREVLLEAVKDLATAVGEKSIVLVTARPYAYADPKWHLDGFEVLGLAPFNVEQVERFIGGWYSTAARRVFAWDEETAAAKGGQLRRALKNRPYLGDLASRPLLLTLMATLHSSWGQLPEDRADLYEETVKLLLGRWQRFREGGEEGGASLSQLLQVEESRLREALEDLAFKVHQRQRIEDDPEARPADISAGELLVAMKPLLGEVGPDELLGYLKNRAGLLIEHSDDVYAFPHRSFQEYLAACHVGSLPEPSERLRELAFADPVWWREVVLLGIGRARRSGLGNAVDLVTKLQPDGPDNGKPTEDHWRVAVLCGQALRELRLQERVVERPHYRTVLERARDWLVRFLDGGLMSSKERLEAGDVLGYLGDPRLGVGGVRAGEVELPAIDWVEVPAGSFVMGSADGELEGLDEERPQHEVFVERFWISRYPVTNAQYRLFWASDDYDRLELWTDAGWEWLQGAEVDVSGYPESVQDQFRDWFAGRPREKRRRPFFWDHEKLAAPSRPVVGVTWHEAVAFCRWLTARLSEQADRSFLNVELKTTMGVRVTLPTEAQWEKAARGTEPRFWPWGAEFDPERCNSKEGGLGEPSPVGMFPENRSPYGVVDMAGNVWERTTTVWGHSIMALDYTYPYSSEDGREDEASLALRVVRGGGWADERSYVRCAARGRGVPEGFDGYLGFRVVLSPADSSL